VADYKLPRVIRLMESLPRTSNGKLLRQAAPLRAAATQAAAMQAAAAGGR
jgi:3-hydroxy-4-methylanthranilate adenylyltransferase